MLQNHDNDRLLPKRELLDEHHARYNTASSRARLEALCHRVERGLYVYDGVPVNELKGLVTARKLRTASKMLKTKAGLMSLLERADEEATFRLLDLPAELRNMVYTHHLQALRTNTGMFLTLPPITRVSKLVRKESMPLFYDNCTVHFDYGHMFNLISHPVDATRFLRHTDLLLGIRNICITGVPKYRRLPSWPNHNLEYALRFTFRLAKNNKMNDMVQIESVGSAQRLDANAASWHLGARHLVRFEHFKDRLQFFHEKLVKRHEQAMLDAVTDGSSGSKIEEDQEVGFVERPRAGLRLQSADFDEFLQLFRTF